MAAALFIPLLALFGQPCSAELQRFEDEEAHMGTKVRVVLFAKDKATAVNAFRAVFKRFRELEDIFSDYRASSECRKLTSQHDAKPGQTWPISKEMATVLKQARAVSEASDGAFDVTIGPLSQLWRLSRREKQLPNPEVLANARARVGYQAIRVFPDPAAADQFRVEFSKTGILLDFGGIAKGYSADQALEVLKTLGITRAMIAVSGDIVVGDPPPDREHWTISIAPVATGRPGRTVYLANRAVSTSGDLFQYVEIAGVRYSHVLDPKTGLGQTGRRSTTLIAASGILSDGYSKAVALLPPDKALALVERLPDAAAYIVVKENEQAPEVVHTSERFKNYSK
ncbi:MAG: FAD:protein FMN transferase [Gemmataceae bacterium]